MKHRDQQPETGAALVITVIVVAVLAVVAAAFMQTSSTDRLSSRTVADYYKAQLAAEAGLADSIHRLLVAVGTNRNFIVAETNHASGFAPVLLAGLRDATLPTNMYPLVSGDLAVFASVSNNSSALTNYLAARITSSADQSVDMNLGQLAVIQSTNTMPAGSTSNWFRAPWVVTNVVITNPSGVKITNLFRYAFWVSDEQARLNPMVHKGLTNQSRTNFGRSASEIRVDSTNFPLVLDATALANITNNASNIVTADTLAVILGSSYSTNKHLVSAQSVIDEDIIPAGYLTTNGGVTNFVPYADAGKPKYNVNDVATNTSYGSTPEERAGVLTGIISSNLPDFHERDLGSQLAGLTNALYPMRLAASIIDYIDTDTIPSHGLGGEIAGKDLTPYVVMVAERNTWVSETPVAPFVVNISSEFFVQLWNPYTTDMSGNIKFKVGNRQEIRLPGGGSPDNFRDFESSDVPVVLRPNEMRVYLCGSTNQLFTNQLVRPSSSNSLYPRWTNTSLASASLTGNPQFVMMWNTNLADMSRYSAEGAIMAAPATTGLARTDTGDNFGPVGVQRFSFNCAPQNSPNSVADPRGNYLCSADFPGFNNIALARFQGRQTDTATRSQNFVTTWAARDYVRENAPEGAAIASLAENPTLLASTWSSNVAKAAPIFLRNSPMMSVGELGNIFDPAMVSDSGAAVFGGTLPNYFRQVGGRSLRTGQPESPYWDTSGKRAIQLLDLFTINPLGTNTNQLGTSVYTNSPSMVGRINVNTAPKPVLASVFEGVTINSDEGISAATALAGNIADAIITNRPYSRISDLYKALPAFANGTNYNPNIVNISVTVTNAATSPATTSNYVAMAAMDRAREELFARTVNLLTTQSRAFRIYVVGETLDKQTNAVSRAALEAVVRLEPKTGVDGLTPRIIFRKIQ